MVGWDWTWYLMSRYIGIPTGDAPGEAPKTGGELVGVDSFTMRSRPAVHIPHNTQHGLLNHVLSFFTLTKGSSTPGKE